MTQTTQDSRLVRFMSGALASVSRTLFDKLGDRPPSLTDFGAVGDETFDCTAAIAKAEACASPVIHVPAGVYLGTQVVTTLTKQYTGEGQLKLPAYAGGQGYQRAKTILNNSENLPFGGLNSASLFGGWNGNWKRNKSATEVTYSGDVFNYTGAGAYYRPEVYPEVTSIYNTVGRDGMVGGTLGDRTIICADYKYLEQAGHGDMVALCGIVDLHGQSSNTNDFLQAGAAGLVGGQVHAYNDHCYINPFEVQLKDNGYNVACVGWNINMFRQSNHQLGSAAVAGQPTAPNHPWIGYRSVSFANPVDVGYQVGGKHSIGLDLTGAELETREGNTAAQAAITMKAGQKVYFNAPATSYPEWSPLWPGAVQNWDNTYIMYDAGISGFLIAVHNVGTVEITSTGVRFNGNVRLPDVSAKAYADNAAALAAGLAVGTVYHSAGVLKIVV